MNLVTLETIREDQERAANRAVLESEIALLKKETPEGSAPALRLAQTLGLLLPCRRTKMLENVQNLGDAELRESKLEQQSKRAARGFALLRPWARARAHR